MCSFALCFDLPFIFVCGTMSSMLYMCVRVHFATGDYFLESARKQRRTELLLNVISLSGPHDIW